MSSPVFLRLRFTCVLKRIFSPIVIAWFAAVVFASLIYPFDANADFRKPPNSRIAIDLDLAFKTAKRYKGFVNPSNGTSYVIIEMPRRAYAELKSMPEHEANLKERGLSDAKVGKLAGRDGDYVYFTARQVKADETFAKFVLIFLENSVTGFVTATVPQTALDGGKVTSKQIEDTLATVRVEAEPGPETRLFELQYLGAMKLAGVFEETAELYNMSGEIPKSGDNRMVLEPALLITPSLSSDVVTDVAQLAKDRFSKLSGLSEVKISEESAVTIGGLQGYQIMAEGRTASVEGDKGRIAVQFVMLASDVGGYFILFGTLPAAMKEKYMPELEQVIASFRPSE